MNPAMVAMEIHMAREEIRHFGLPLTYAYATLWQSVAGNSPFQGIFFCNLSTPNTVISKCGKYCYPIFFPCKYRSGGAREEP
jgi:hypothetical protein